VTGVYLLFFGGHYVSGDNSYTIAWAKALVDHGSNDISEYKPDAKYCSFGVGRMLIQLPFLLAARGVKATTAISCEGPAVMILYALNGGLGVVLIYRLLLRYGVDVSDAWLRAAVIGLTSIWFPYTKLDHPEALLTTCLLGMWLLAPQYPMLAGLVGGAACTLRPEAVLWTGLTGLCLPVSLGYKARVVLGALPGLALFLAGNWLRSGSAVNPGYGGDYVRFIPIYVGLYGILFSAGKSVFLYSPILVLFPVSLPETWCRPETRPLVRWAMVLLGAQVLFFANFFYWPGDDSWGVRYVIPGVMIALTALTCSEQARGWAFWMLAVAGFVVQLAAVLVGPHETLMLLHTRQPVKQDMLQDSQSPITLDDMRFHPRYSQLTSTFELCWINLTGRVPRSRQPHLEGSTWSEGFDPALSSEMIRWDIFWLHLHKLQTRRSTESS
jgi:hypothetical protein